MTNGLHVANLGSPLPIMCATWLLSRTRVMRVHQASTDTVRRINVASHICCVLASGLFVRVNMTLANIAWNG